MSTIAVVTSCGNGYGRYLADWARSIVAQERKPDEAVIFTHGSAEDEAAGHEAAALLAGTCLVTLVHHAAPLDFGEARNRAVALTSSEWVCHFDADDELMPHALSDWQRLAPGADVVAFGYARSGDLAAGPKNPTRLYSDLTGTAQILDAAAPCSGVSPFRRSLWERRPYRTDLLGAWDTALWLGFAYLEPRLRIRATARPVFWYRQHADSVFNTRRKAQDWTRAHVEASLQTLRRDCRGVSVIVPLDTKDRPDRRRLWRHVADFYRRFFPGWEIVEGYADGGRGWRKGVAIADALERARGRVLVIADADVLIDPAALAEAVDRVGGKEVPWAVPHRDVVRLNAEATERQLAALPEFVTISTEDLVRPLYEGFAGGGLLVVDRVAYVASGGIPASFVGWGAEDQALAVILDTCAGIHWRGQAPLVHLWHEPQEKQDRTANRARLRAIRAAAARGRDALMLFLRTGRNEDAIPTWKRRGIERAAANALPQQVEPAWIRKAKERADKVAARRARDA